MLNEDAVQQLMRRIGEWRDEDWIQAIMLLVVKEPLRGKQQRVKKRLAV